MKFARVWNHRVTNCFTHSCSSCMYCKSPLARIHKAASTLCLPSAASSPNSISTNSYIQHHSNTSKYTQSTLHSIIFRNAIHPSSSSCRCMHTSNAACGPMQEFVLADIGEGIAEVELMSWHVEVGDTISQFDPVCEVQSDKATVEITSRFDGVVRAVHFQIGEMAPVGASLISIELPDGTKATTVNASDMQKPGEIATVVAGDIGTKCQVVPIGETGESGEGKILTTPAVRRVAREHNVDLSQVQSTGPKGRLLKEDVLNFIRNQSSEADKKPIKVSSNALKTAPSSDKDFVAKNRVEKISGIKRIMVQTMIAANAVPTFTLHEDVYTDALMAIRQELKPLAESMDVRLTLMPFFIKCASLALNEFPNLNAHVNDACTEITIRTAHNICIAIDTPRGLMVPSIKHVEQLSLIDVARQLNLLIAKGRDAQLGAQELDDGTFSLSNIGSIGGTYATPLIAPPQVVIGAIGRTQIVPRFADDTKIRTGECVEHDQVIGRSVTSFSWSGDHRVLDGATVTRFSNLFKDYCEKPNTMMLNMR